MKRAEGRPIRVSQSVHDLLTKVAVDDPMRFTLGQLVNKLAIEKYGHLLKTSEAGQQAGGEAL